MRRRRRRSCGSEVRGELFCFHTVWNTLLRPFTFYFCDFMMPNVNQNKLKSTFLSVNEVLCYTQICHLFLVMLLYDEPSFGFFFFFTCFCRLSAPLSFLALTCHHIWWNDLLVQQRAWGCLPSPCFRRWHRALQDLEYSQQQQHTRINKKKEKYHSIGYYVYLRELDL